MTIQQRQRAEFERMAAVLNELSHDITEAQKVSTDAVDSVLGSAAVQMLTIINNMSNTLHHIDTMRKYSNDYPIQDAP